MSVNFEISCKLSDPPGETVPRSLALYYQMRAFFREKDVENVFQVCENCYACQYDTLTPDQVSLYIMHGRKLNNRIQIKKWERENPDKVAASKEHWRRKNRERILLIKKRYRENNKNKLRDYMRIYRDRIRNKKGD